MELGTFTPPPPLSEIGDRMRPRDVVGRPLIIAVRELRNGIKTPFNSNPSDKGYKPEGSEGIVVDVTDIRTDEVWIGALWMGAIVRQLREYVGQVVPVCLSWQTPPSGGNPFVNAAPLEGPDLALAQHWARANPDRFETERDRRSRENTPTTAPAAVSAPREVARGVNPPASIAVDPAQDPQILALLDQVKKIQAS
jgi:hypothetical protein